MEHVCLKVKKQKPKLTLHSVVCLFFFFPFAAGWLFIFSLLLRAYVHQYTKFGISEEDFLESFTMLEQIISSYTNLWTYLIIWNFIQWVITACLLYKGKV